MSIFLKIALISFILIFVFAGIVKIQATNRDPIDQLLGNHTTGEYIAILLFLLSVLSSVVFGILSIIFWK